MCIKDILIFHFIFFIFFSLSSMSKNVISGLTIKIIFHPCVFQSRVLWVICPYQSMEPVF